MSQLIHNEVRLRTPAGTCGLQIRVPQRGEPNPLGDDGIDRIQRERAPAEDDWESTESEAVIALLAAVASELKSPVQGTEEGKKDSSVCCLNVQSLVQDCDSHTGVD